MAFGRLICMEIGAPGKKATRIQDLYMSFDIVKTWQTTKNVADVKIYNLSRSTAELIGAQGNKVNIKIGYDDEDDPENLKSIFSGELVKSDYGKEGVNKVMSFQALDNFASSVTAQIWQGDKVLSVSYEKGTSLQVIYNYLVSQMNISVTGIVPEITGIAANGYSDTGRVTQLLGKILKRCGYNWSVVAGKMVIYQGSKPSIISTLHLSLGHGLINVKYRDQKYVLTEQTKNWTGKKYTVTSLLFPELYPLTQILVDLPANEGNGVDDNETVKMEIETAKLTGDNMGGEWKAIMDTHVVN